MIVGLIKSMLGKSAPPSCCAVTPDAKTHDVLHVDTSACEADEEKAASSCGPEKKGCGGCGCG